jgi:hypothetical protein
MSDDSEESVTSNADLVDLQVDDEEEVDDEDETLLEPLQMPAPINDLSIYQLHDVSFDSMLSTVCVNSIHYYITSSCLRVHS